MKTTAIRERRLRTEGVNKVQSLEVTIRGLQNQIQCMQIGGLGGQQMHFNRFTPPILFPTETQPTTTAAIREIEMLSIESVEIPDYLL